MPWNLSDILDDFFLSVHCTNDLDPKFSTHLHTYYLLLGKRKQNNKCKRKVSFFEKRGGLFLVVTLICERTCESFYISDSLQFSSISLFHMVKILNSFLVEISLHPNEIHGKNVIRVNNRHEKQKISPIASLVSILNEKKNNRQIALLCSQFFIMLFAQRRTDF